MSYNKYGTRNSSRYNFPRSFVPGGELNSGRPQGNYGNHMGLPQQIPNVQYNKPPPLSQTFNKANTASLPAPAPQQQQQQQQQPPQQKEQDTETNPVAMDTTAGDGSPTRPPWMKSKLQGVKKISNKERRRRQNENLRRLLTPKNALMVLNEIMPGEQVASQFKVEAVPGGAQFYRPNVHSFCADLTLHGNNYKGYGENKLSARNAAAEQAIRDLMLQRMARLLADSRDGTGSSAGSVTGSSTGGATGAKEGDESQEGDGESEEESLPMIQLASYALHKLFAEWEYEGHKVPSLRPAGGAADGAADGAAPARALPAGAGAMHPCMLLTYMRSQLEYRELPPEGDRQHNLVFTMAIDVDGATYVGRAQNKKEARKLAAKAACEALFDVKFENVST
ncbi:double-stranded RNA-specific editase B2-like isoform X2 [Nymphalis io]|uniref:double-stranded RNA-specific editase B2-like isoform X2 n=1 Tax=Inachis io TaxID=171585 RepID=UPI002168FBE9|nr:double-stranded RNA-specific editase B2-like isoform X2 [Nymphalis io]